MVERAYCHRQSKDGLVHLERLYFGYTVCGTDHLATKHVRTMIPVTCLLCLAGMKSEEDEWNDLYK